MFSQNKKTILQTSRAQVVAEINGNIVKLPKNQQASQNLLTEVFLLASLKGVLPLPIPDYHLVDKQENRLLYAVYKPLAGETLYPKNLARLSRDEQSAAAKKLGQFLSVLHSLETPPFLQMGVAKSNPINLFGPFLYLVTQKIQKKNLKKAKKLYDQWFDNESANHFSPVLLHHDFNEPHILYDHKQNKIKGILDFGSAAVGDPYVDFRSLLQGFGKDFVIKVLQHYTGEQKSTIEKKIIVLIEVLDAVGGNVW